MDTASPTPASSRQRRATIAQVAGEASVSRATASAVLLGGGGNTRVGQGTAQRVRKAAERLGYRPNLVAQQLTGRRTKLLGAVVDAQARENVAAALRRMETAATEVGYRLLVGYVHDDYDKIRELADDLIGRQVEGVAMFAHTYPEFGEKVPELFQPIRNTIYIGRPLGDDRLPFVSTDYFESGYCATDHLIRTGRRPLAVQISPSAYTQVHEITTGCKAAAAAHGLGVDDVRFLEAPGYIETARDARQMVDQALDAGARGIMAATDAASAWVIRELHRRGLSVPGDVALVSATRQSFGPSIYPSITSVDQRARGVGARAIRALLQSLEAGKPPRIQTYVKPRLVIGESCGTK